MHSKEDNMDLLVAIGIEGVVIGLVGLFILGWLLDILT